MKLNPENIRISFLLLSSVLICGLIIRTRPQSALIRRIMESGWLETSLEPRDRRRLRKSLKGIKRMEPYLSHSNLCLLEACILHRTLNKLKIGNQVHLGSRKTAEKFTAHAWVSVEGKTVLGGPVDDYVELVRIPQSQK